MLKIDHSWFISSSPSNFCSICISYMIINSINQLDFKTNGKNRVLDQEHIITIVIMLISISNHLFLSEIHSME